MKITTKTEIVADDFDPSERREEPAEAATETFETLHDAIDWLLCKNIREPSCVPWCVGSTWIDDDSEQDPYSGAWTITHYCLDDFTPDQELRIARALGFEP